MSSLVAVSVVGLFSLVAAALTLLRLRENRKLRALSRELEVSYQEMDVKFNEIERLMSENIDIGVDQEEYQRPTIESLRTEARSGVQGTGVLPRSDAVFTARRAGATHNVKNPFKYWLLNWLHRKRLKVFLQAVQEGQRAAYSQLLHLNAVERWPITVEVRISEVPAGEGSRVTRRRADGGLVIELRSIGEEEQGDAAAKVVRSLRYKKSLRDSLDTLPAGKDAMTCAVMEMMKKQNRILERIVAPQLLGQYSNGKANYLWETGQHLLGMFDGSSITEEFRNFGPDFQALLRQRVSAASLVLGPAAGGQLVINQSSSPRASERRTRRNRRKNRGSRGGQR